jgi:lysophospholipase L1-like esterase
MIEHAEDVAMQVMAKTQELGGAVSGEHGIGITKITFLDQKQMEELREFKMRVDPRDLLNPGKLVTRKLPVRPFTFSFNRLIADIRESGLPDKECLIRLLEQVQVCTRCGKCKQVCPMVYPERSFQYNPRNKNMILGALISAGAYIIFGVAVLLIAASLLLITSAGAQDLKKDWANFKRYAKANTEVTAKPKAVLMGDSITDGWPRANGAFFTENNFVGRGISGQTTSQMLVRFRRDVVDHHPKYVAILAGTNDIALNNGYISLENILGNIISMCEIAKANKIKPVICSVIPAKAYRWRPEVTDAAQQIMKLNEMLKEYAKANKIMYVDYHSAMADAEGGLPIELAKDGVHPTPEGYKIMEEILVKALK